MAITLVYGLNRQLRHVIFMLREDQLVRNLILSQQFGYKRQVLKPAAETSHGIDYDVPNIRYIGLLHDTTF